jgi:hypothetical protein
MVSVRHFAGPLLRREQGQNTLFAEFAEWGRCGRPLISLRVYSATGLLLVLYELTRNTSYSFRTIAVFICKWTEEVKH